jgi:hypothetical protein
VGTTVAMYRSCTGFTWATYLSENTLIRGGVDNTYTPRFTWATYWQSGQLLPFFPPFVARELATPTAAGGLVRTACTGHVHSLRERERERGEREREREREREAY